MSSQVAKMAPRGLLSGKKSNIWKLHCAIENDFSPVLVEIGADEPISKLKQHIQSGRQALLKDVDATDLVLYKVSECLSLVSTMSPDDV